MYYKLNEGSGTAIVIIASSVAGVGLVSLAGLGTVLLIYFLNAKGAVSSVYI